MKISPKLLDLIKLIAEQNCGQVSDIMLSDLGIDITDIDVIEYLSAEGIVITYESGKHAYNNMPESEIRANIKAYRRTYINGSGCAELLEPLRIHFDKHLRYHAFKHSHQDYQKFEDRYHQNLLAFYRAVAPGAFDTEGSTYFASYLEACLNNEQNRFTRKDRSLPITDHMSQLYLKIAAAVNAIDSDKSWGEMSDKDFEAIAAKITELYPDTIMSASRVKSIMIEYKTKNLVTSIDEPYNEDFANGGTIADNCRMFKAGEYGEDPETMDEHVEMIEKLEAISDILRTLDPDVAKAFLLVKYRNFSQQKTADIMHKSRTTVQGYCNQATVAIRKGLAKKKLFSYDD